MPESSAISWRIRPASGAAASASSRRNELDLLFRERPHLDARQRQHAERHALAHHRHAEHGAVAVDPARLREGIVGIGLHVGKVDDPSFEERAAGDRSGGRDNRHVLHVVQEFRRVAVSLGAVEDAVDLTGDRAAVGVAELRRRCDEGVQHRLQVEGRAADRLQYVGGRRLLLERFPELIRQPRISYGDHRLARERFQDRHLPTAAPEKSFTPLGTMASNTGFVSSSERLMTARISEVAVCCWSDSESSAVRA
jgi:hypothetical protein